MEYSIEFIKYLEEIPSTRNLDNIYQDPYKAKNLDIYLSSMKLKNPKALLLGGCPTFSGSRKTGIPFTDEYYVGNTKVELEDDTQEKELLPKVKKWEKHNPVKKERGSKIVWENLSIELEELLLWNIFPFYPHTANVYGLQRKLSDQEMELSLELLLDLLDEFPTITTILVASDLAAKIIKHNPELSSRYTLFYVSAPAISKADEFIGRVKLALKYKDEIIAESDHQERNEIAYEYRRRWADMSSDGSKFYCRMLNRILPIEKDYYCEFCPCHLGEKFYCGYYDFNRTDVNTPLEAVKRRFDMVIAANLSPLFPDYIKRTRLSDVIVEQALQLVAPIYRNEIHEESGEPYIVYILTRIHTIYDYILQLNKDHQKDVLAALVLYRVFKRQQISPAKVQNEFGDYVLSLLSEQHPEHEENLYELYNQLNELDISEEIMDIFHILKQS